MSVHPNNLSYYFDDLFDEDIHVCLRLLKTLENIRIDSRRAQFKFINEYVIRATNQKSEF